MGTNRSHKRGFGEVRGSAVGDEAGGRLAGKGVGGMGGANP